MSKVSTGKPKRNIWKDPSPYGEYTGERGNTEQWKKAFNFKLGKDEAIEYLKEESPWVILDIVEGSSQETIKKAFYKLMLKNHPDKGGNLEYAQKIVAAYEVLKD